MGGKHVAVVVAEQSDKSLVFGATWRSVAARTGGRADALKLARKAGASHFIFKQQQYGYAKVPNDAEGWVYPASQVVARQHGGDALYVIELFPNEYWLSLIRLGQPTDVDKVIHSDFNESVIDSAKEQIKIAADEGTTLAVYSNIEGNGFDGAKFLSPADILIFANVESDRLDEIPKGQTSIPKPALIVIGIVIMAIAANKGWNMYQQHQRQKLAALNAIAEEEPADAWKRAIQQWESSRVAQNPRGLAVVRESLGNIPVLWNGWYLQSAVCSASTGVANAASGVTTAPTSISTRSWNCSANYQRMTIGTFNRDMDAKALPGWTVQYKGLDSIVAAWKVNQDTAPFKIADIDTTNYYQKETVSRIQRLIPAFGQLNSPNFSQSNIAPPKKADGTSVPVPADIPQIVEAEIVIKAPLRSVDALINGDVYADWTQIVINFTPSSSDLTISLKGSALTADVRGVIYAKAN